MAAMVKVPKESLFIRRGSKINTWYVLIQGSVQQRTAHEAVTIPEGSVIGIMECATGQCRSDYMALEDCTLYPMNYSEPGDLEQTIASQPKYGTVFLQTALRDAGFWMKRYEMLHETVQKYNATAAGFYRTYQELCEESEIEQSPLVRMENRDQFLSMEKEEGCVWPESWEIRYYAGLCRTGAKAVSEFCGEDYSLLAGQILHAGRAAAEAMEAADTWKEILRGTLALYLNPQREDLLALYFRLETEAAMTGQQWEKVHAQTEQLIEFIGKSRQLDAGLVEQRLAEYRQCDFRKLLEEAQQRLAAEGGDEEGEDCLVHILSYAGKTPEEIGKIRDLLQEYNALSEEASIEEQGRRLRKNLTGVFYEIYQKVFLRTVKEKTLTPILEMFLYFGFMDVSTAGEECADELYDLTERIDVCRSDNVYTMYDWLKSIYEGKNEPSRNEFDLDYVGYLAEQRRMGKLKDSQIEALKQDNWAKTVFEMENMFVSTNRATYGRVTSFCPVLSRKDMLQSAEKMLVTAKRIEDAIHHVRAIDFSLFYREVVFSDPQHGVNSEMIQKEVIPCVILMPNPGSRAMMWQETAGAKRDTPARFVFPIMTMYSLEEMVIETCGRFRWEMCRKIQGMRWNDITEKSLTSEYCDYLQFYRKNRDLSADTKEKLRNALVKAKNNYREVFVMDYVNWIRYESNGSYRLNRVAREIIFRYCPFTKVYRDALAANPMYQEIIQRFQIMNDRKRKYVEGFGNRYEKSGGTITIELQENLAFYDM